MLSEWELWACANRVLQTHGEEAALHVAEQIGALVLEGDAEGPYLAGDRCSHRAAFRNRRASTAH